MINKQYLPAGRVHLIGIVKTIDPHAVIGPVLSRLGVDPRNCFFVDAHEVRTVGEVADAIPADAEWVVINNVVSLIHRPVSMNSRRVMSELQLLAQNRNLRIIGITTASKTGGRERINGTHLWAHRASTVVLVDPGPTTATISVTVIPLNLAPAVLTMQLDPESTRQFTDSFTPEQSMMLRLACANRPRLEKVLTKLVMLLGDVLPALMPLDEGQASGE